MNVGILAVQGDYEAHAQALQRLGVTPVLVKHAQQLPEVQGLVLPGGESTTFLKFLNRDGLASAISNAVRDGLPVLGTCAGAILLAARVENPPQESLGLLDATVRRNAYGRQVDSFIASGDFLGQPMEMVFIRAPQFAELGPDVEVLGVCRDQPVFVRQKNVMAGAFHPELGKDGRVHQLLLDAIRARTPRSEARGPRSEGRGPSQEKMLRQTW
jgi:5'-phosphate synthase pdxT subunit